MDNREIIDRVVQEVRALYPNYGIYRYEISKKLIICTMRQEYPGSERFIERILDETYAVLCRLSEDGASSRVFGIDEGLAMQIEEEVAAGVGI